MNHGRRFYYVSGPINGADGEFAENDPFRGMAIPLNPDGGAASEVERVFSVHSAMYERVGDLLVYTGRIEMDWSQLGEDGA